MFPKTYNWFLLIFNLFTQVICLKDLRISVPEVVAVGDTVTLSCVYDLEDAALYSIRWYIDQEEFYRYVAREKPPALAFSIFSGIKVDLSRSTETNVVLIAVERTQSGNYQCEVSADAPYFHTETKASPMLIAQLPESEPIITIYGIPGIENKHAISFGETFKASCVSGYSDPSVNFTWTVNGVRYPSTNTGFRLIDGLHNQEAWSDIIVNVDNQIMKSSINHLTLIVRCETNIYNLYHGVAETELNIIRDIYWTPYDNVESPSIIDQQQRSTGTAGGTTGPGGGNLQQGDPGNSALTDSAAATKSQLFLYKFYYFLFMKFVHIISQF